jgi:acyl-CoA thioester hydrolase
MRWADMDQLGHVNNVKYLEYVTEAREALFEGLSARHAPVTRHRVQFASPLVYRRRPVLVDSWVTDVTETNVGLAHEVYDAPATPEEERTVYLRASSRVSTELSPLAHDLAVAQIAPDHDWRAVADDVRPGGTLYQLTVRRADIDEHGFVRDVAFFEYFQEARIQLVMNLHTRGQEWTHHVVARTDIDFVEPVPHRRAPYVVRSWIGHVGTRSFTIQAELLDDERVLARASVVMVTFDMEAQRPKDMAASQRERLLAELASGEAG